MIEQTVLIQLHHKALQDWYVRPPHHIMSAQSLHSLIKAQHFCNFTLWNYEDEVRSCDLEDAFIVELKRGIDMWNQRRNDLIEEIDAFLLSTLPLIDGKDAQLNSETAGSIVDRLSILALKIYHINNNIMRTESQELAKECKQRRGILIAQYDELLGCLYELLADYKAGRRYFKRYYQLKSYNDPRLNPALSMVHKSKKDMRYL